MNEALKTKCLWRLVIEVDALWKKVIVSKYGTDSFGWWSKRSPYAHAVGCQKSIYSSLDFFRSIVCFEVENGCRVLFWLDKWCGEQLLKFQFPSPFRMTCLRDVKVQDVLCGNGSHHYWDITFTRSLNDW